IVSRARLPPCMPWIQDGSSSSIRSTTARTGSSCADAHLPVEAAHLAAEVLAHNRVLVAWLDEEIGRERALGRLLEQHHGVPVCTCGVSRKRSLCRPRSITSPSWGPATRRA